MAGLSMGLVVAVIVYIGRPAQPMPMAPASGTLAQTAKPRTKVEIPPKEDPRFDFYTLLAKEQVVVTPGTKPPKNPTALQPLPGPAAATPAVPAAIGAAPSAAPASGSDKYLVLAGSFRDQANAEQHRARLALAGIEARVESITGQDSGTWHRVRIGPQNSLSRAEAALAQLRAGGFEGRVLRQP